MKVNTKTTDAAPRQAPRGGHLPAAAILVLGGIAAAAFRSDAPPPQAPRVEAADVLVRRTTAPAPVAERSTTQLLGYVESTVGTGTAARPNPRTAAQIDRTAAWQEVGAAGAMSHPAAVAAPPAMPARFDDARSSTGASVRASSSSWTADRGTYAVPQPRTAAAAPAPWATMKPYASADDAGEYGALTSTPGNAARRHVVRDGDTLGDMAQRYYGDAARYREIFDANRAVLSDPQMLPIGATLVIPAFDPRVVPPPADPPSARLVPQMILPSR